MAASPKEMIADQLTSFIPKDVLLDFEHNAHEAYEAARRVGAMHMEGLRSSGVGYNLHLFLNGGLARAFANAGITPPPLRGNSIVFGTVGPVTVIRVHKSQAQWDNAGRSKGKRKLCSRNKEVTEWFQPDILKEEQPIPGTTEMTVSLVTQACVASEAIAIYVVVTDDTMDFRNPLFRESLPEFMQRYQRVPGVVDNVVVKLRKQPKKADSSHGPDEQGMPEIT